MNEKQEKPLRWIASALNDLVRRRLKIAQENYLQQTTEKME